MFRRAAVASANVLVEPRWFGQMASRSGRRCIGTSGVDGVLSAMAEGGRGDGVAP
jgi:hypothetical protein